ADRARAVEEYLRCVRIELDRKREVPSDGEQALACSGTGPVASRERCMEDPFVGRGDSAPVAGVAPIVEEVLELAPYAARPSRRPQRGHPPESPQASVFDRLAGNGFLGLQPAVPAVPRRARASEPSAERAVPAPLELLEPLPHPVGRPRLILRFQ